MCRPNFCNVTFTSHVTSNAALIRSTYSHSAYLVGRAGFGGGWASAGGWAGFGGGWASAGGWAGFGGGRTSKWSRRNILMHAMLSSCAHA